MKTHTLTRKGRDAPRQEALIKLTHDLVTSRAPEVPEDGYDRVDFRMELVLEGLYDGDQPDDRDAPVRDLLTDVLHLCDANGWDVRELLGRAEFMRDQEVIDWGRQ